MNTLYDLVKRIDALTANSQQVLNALIRSCLATGSSSGYRVNKFGQEIELSRADIYRLYDFYNTWEQAGFPSDEKFDRLLDRADRRWRRGKDDTSTLATDAVVKHSKILYMVSSNKNTYEPEYWTGKIKGAASGKAVAATAPIPLNLRTPLYDENLSVKSFSQYETYLFPIGYQRMEILGTPDNGEDYLAGGKTWEIDATDSLIFSANHIHMGIRPAKDASMLNYGDAKYTFSWGDESYATGDRAAALGYRNLGIGGRSLAIGQWTMAYGRAALSTGMSTVSIGPGSVSMNCGTIAGATYSIAANENTVTGGLPYEFTVPATPVVTVSTGSVECVGNDSPETVSDCYLTTEAQTANAKFKDIIIRVSKADIERNQFDIRIGDNVNIFGVYGMSNGKRIYAYDDTGYAYRLFTTHVVGVSEGDLDDYYTYTVKLADPIPADWRMMPAGGTIQSTIRVVPQYNGLMVHDRERILVLGRNSVALNCNTVAHGDNQTVVGTSNLPDDNAKFIVGTGSANLTSGSEDSELGVDPTRANGLLVASKYGYFKLFDGTAGFSVSVSDSDGSGWDSGFRMYRGATMRAGDLNDLNGMVNVRDSRALMLSSRGSSISAMIGTTGDSYSNESVVSAYISSRRGAAVIISGSTVNEGTPLIDTMLSESKIIDGNEPTNDVAVYAEDGIEIRSIGTGKSGIHIWANSYLTQTFSHLKLEGDTFGTLTATKDCRSHILDSDTPDISYSGFYYVRGLNNNDGGNWKNNDKRAHILNSAGPDGKTVMLALPSSTDDTGINRPLLKLENGEIKEMAYYDDTVIYGYMSSGMVVTAGYDDNNPNNIRLVDEANTGKLPLYLAGMSVADQGDYIARLKYMHYNYVPGMGLYSNHYNTNEIDIYNISDEDVPICACTNIHYSLNGRNLVISMDVTQTANANSITGISVAFMLGLKPNQCNFITPLSGDYPFELSNMGLRGEYIYGQVDNKGMVYLHITTTGAVRDHAVHYVATGIAPFTADEACWGFVANTSWDNATTTYITNNSTYINQWSAAMDILTAV